MKALMISAALALGALTMAAPASAQDFRGGPGYDRSPAYERTAFVAGHPYAERSRHQLDRIGDTLRFGIRSGEINRREARRLTSELRAVQDMRVHFIRTNGMSGREAAVLQDRIQRLRFAVNRQMRDGDRRFGAF